MRQLAFELVRRERYVIHGHYNNDWSIICPIPLLARTVHRDRHTQMKGRNLTLCVKGRKMWAGGRTTRKMWEF